MGNCYSFNMALQSLTLTHIHIHVTHNRCGSSVNCFACELFSASASPASPLLLALPFYIE